MTELEQLVNLMNYIWFATTIILLLLAGMYKKERDQYKEQFEKLDRKGRAKRRLEN